MDKLSVVIASGGIIWKENRILLVRVTYGKNRGLWMLPGGLVEVGEAVENGALREVMEETSIKATIINIAGIRTGVRIFEEYNQTNVYIVFNMNYVSGIPTPDNEETSEVAYFTIEEIKNMNDIVALTKEIVLNSIDSVGLNKKTV